MLHHITTPARRLAVLSNLAQLLRPGGLGLVTVWAQEQHLDLESADTLTPCPTAGTEQGIGRRHFDSQDVFVDWQLKKPGEEGEVFYRYYHVFQEGELARLIGQIQEIQIIKLWYDKANWCAVFKRL